MSLAYPPLPNEQFINCKTMETNIDRVVLTYTGVYVRQKNGGWVELKNLMEEQRQVVPINSIAE